MKDQFIEDLIESRKNFKAYQAESAHTVAQFEEEYPELS